MRTSTRRAAVAAQALAAVFFLLAWAFTDTDPRWMFLLPAIAFAALAGITWRQGENDAKPSAGAENPRKEGLDPLIVDALNLDPPSILVRSVGP